VDWLGLCGRGALVVGAGGLGAACAEALAAQGARVMVCDIDDGRLSRLAGRITGAGGQAGTVRADLRSAEESRAAVSAAAGQLGRLDIFVHAVGRNDRRPVLDLDDDAWESLVTLNLSSAYWTGQAAGRAMCTHGGGRMVFLSSVSGLLAHADHAPYAASKGGLNQMTRVMAREWAAHGVCVNAVAPGYVETDLTSGYLARPGVRAGLTAMVPSGRLGRPEEVADAVTFLASDRAGFITGHVLYVDGGRVLV
jgi:NAD(P)-dependent dehydrogenase (short-subunit alcohol dehydrogenase family)